MPKKNRRGVTPLYLETKVKVGLSLTPSGAERLNGIAKKLRISRSELIERIARGDFAVSGNAKEVTVTLKTGAEVGKTATTSSEEKDGSQIDEMAPVEESGEAVLEEAAEPDSLLEDYQALQQQSEAQAAELATLQAQLTKLQHLESELQQSVPQASYQALQQQSEAQAAELASLQAQLTKLQHLESELQQSVPQASYQTLQQQSEAQAAELATLQAQLTKLHHLESELQQSVPQASYQTLQQHSEVQAGAIAHLQQQLAQLQLLQHAAVPSVPLQSYQTLHRHSEAQAHTITALQQQLAELRRFATVGEAHLNKWRTRNFKS